MGDTFAVWSVKMPDGVTHCVVAKAYAAASSIAKRLYPAHVELDLVTSKSWAGGETWILEDDDTLRKS